MKHPCTGCLVSSCCSKRCRDYAVFIYETRNYEQAGKAVKDQIKAMPYEKAIDHILYVENLAMLIMDHECPPL